MCFFLTGKSRFWKRYLQPFLDLKNSKACTHVCNLLNLSDLKNVAKILFKNTKYYKKSENLHATLDSQVPIFLEKLPPEGYLMTPFTKYSKEKALRVDLRSFLQIIYDIGTEFLIFHCFATKMLFSFCKSMILVRFCTILPLHACAGIKTRFKALLKTQYLTLGPNV